ncbi:MAG: YciI family protein [Phycisphaera sp.]|nr:MAG: YciI family protein [Phycisphaera sp.]
MTIARIAGIAALAGLLAIAGCSSGTRSYTMTFIKTGPLSNPTPEQSAQAMAGHMANMRRLAAEGTLLIAGPLAEPKSDPAHRGIFVFDAATVDKGEALAATDPAAQMGVFEMDTYLLKTDAPLTELTRLENEYEQRRLNDEDVPDEWVGRMYIMASAPYSKELHERVHGADGVLITAKLIKDKRDQRVFLWLDAPNAQLARDLLPDAEWTMHGWYGSPTVAELPGLQGEE